MSAVILAVIVIMWAVVLVPMWLRRHDAATESRSVDRFSTAMRVLSRRSTSSPDRRYVLMPRRDSGVAVHVSGATRRARTAPVESTAGRAARPSLAVRRRRTLLVLLGVVGLTFVLAIAGVMWWALQIVGDLLLAGFVVHLRTQAKRAAAVSRQRRRAAVAPAASSAAPVAPVAEPVTSTEAAAASETEVAVAVDDGSWEPVPVPPPTYTMKPAAPPRRYVPIEEPEPVVAPAAPAVPAAVAETEPATEIVEPDVADGDDELDGILTRRWAVND